MTTPPSDDPEFGDPVVRLKQALVVLRALTRDVEQDLFTLTPPLRQKRPSLALTLEGLGQRLQAIDGDITLILGELDHGSDPDTWLSQADKDAP